MKLSHDQVRHIAELAKLALTDEEVERFATQLTAILDHFQMLNHLNTEAVPPTAHVLPLRNITRADIVEPSLTPEEVLSNAPQRVDDLFRVKPILE